LWNTAIASAPWNLFLTISNLEIWLGSQTFAESRDTNLKTCFRLDQLFVRIQGMEKREAREMEKTTNFHIWKALKANKKCNADMF
jgi:hypothetical protein